MLTIANVQYHCKRELTNSITIYLSAELAIAECEPYVHSHLWSNNNDLIRGQAVLEAWGKI